MTLAAAPDACTAMAAAPSAPQWHAVAERDCRPGHGRFDMRWFYTHHVDRGLPVILRGAAATWPAVQRWSLDHLARLGEDVSVVVSRSREEAEATVKDGSMTLAQYIRAHVQHAPGHPATASHAGPRRTPVGTRSGDTPSDCVAPGDGAGCSGGTDAGSSGASGAGAGAGAGAGEGASGSAHQALSRGSGCGTGGQDHDRTGVDGRNAGGKPQHVRAGPPQARPACATAGPRVTGTGPPATPTAPYLKQYDLLSQFPDLNADLRCHSLFTPKTLFGTTFAWMGPAYVVHRPGRTNSARSRTCRVDPMLTASVHRCVVYTPVCSEQRRCYRHP